MGVSIWMHCDNLFFKVLYIVYIYIHCILIVFSTTRWGGGPWLSPKGRKGSHVGLRGNKI